VKPGFSLHLNASWLPWLASAFLIFAYNFSFWKNFLAASSPLAGLGMLVLLLLLFGAALTVFNVRFVIKPLLVILFLVSSVASYFLDQYSIPIDWQMVQNVAETDLREGTELLSWNLLLQVALLGMLPALVLIRTELRFPALRRALWIKAATLGAALALASLLLILLYKSLAPTLREHRELRFMLTPTNTIQAVNGYLRRRWQAPLRLAPLGTDASRGKLWTSSARRTVTVIVVGETARAANFSLNNYRRNTNPELALQSGLFNFNNVQSCGTATAVSVPCVFSALGRSRYSDVRAQSQEGLLDVLMHAGLDVLWRDNNSGCKGVCERARFEDLSRPVPGDALCNDQECFDERLLVSLPEMIRAARRDMVIVLHQKGSHGPAYWKRYPLQFKRFGPVCQTNTLANCDVASIVAAYDNSIVYTDHVLSQAIDLLRRASLEDQVDTSLIYFSDHGESLGERNMYLHGAPYIISPDEQRHVPLMVWLSDSFRARFRINAPCLAAQRAQQLSHDNIFHSTLGMLDISTAAYNPRLDLFHACREHV
jgi:lipid A ethanolaminephosphotransferase